MKRKALLAFLLVCIVVAVVLFFPVKKTCLISGDGAVLTLGKEKVGDCTMSVEIQELNSLVTCYRRSYAFTVGNTTITKFESNDSVHVDQDGGVNFVWQAYFSDTDGAYHFSDLIYASDLSYACLLWEDNLYYLDNGANMDYSKIPFSRAGD